MAESGGIKRDPSVANVDLARKGEALVTSDPSKMEKAESLFRVDKGANLYSVTPGGQVSSHSDACTVAIITIGGTGSDKLVFLQVADYSYPLVAGSSPVLVSNFGAYIFPDLNTSPPASYMAVMFTESVPQDTRQKFHDILKTNAVIVEEVSDHMSSTPHRGPLSLDRQLKKGVEQLDKQIHKGVDQLDKHLQKGVLYALDVADKSVKVSGDVARKLGEEMIVLSKTLATKNPKSQNSSDADKGGQTTSGTDKGGQAATDGFESLCVGMNGAARTLDKHLSKGQSNAV